MYDDCFLFFTTKRCTEVHLFVVMGICNYLRKIGFVQARRPWASTISARI